MSVQQTADTILISNAVFTGLTDRPEAASIAIVGNKIAAVGSEEQIKPFIGPQTKCYHFENQLIMPGFHDFHLHILAGCLISDSLNLSGARSEREAVDMVREYANARPNDPWIVGIGWDSGYWENKQLPHRSSLDQVLPDRPVLLLHAETHYAWVNSAALKRRSIDRDTPNPHFGVIGRDESGEPNGLLYEKAIGMSQVSAEMFEFSNGSRSQLFHGFLKEAARFGITSVHDLHANGTPALNGHQNLDLFKQTEKEGELTLRIYFSSVLNGELDEARRLRDVYKSGKLRFSGLKQFLDGVITGRTAYMVEPYSDRLEDCGSTPNPKETVKKWVVEADREGFQVRFHAIGDAAVRLALDAFEEARNRNGTRDSRHSVEHVEVVHPDDLDRFHKLGAIASIQPEHIVTNERGTFIDRLGPERLTLYSPINTLRRSGATVAFGTDFPVVSLNPLPGVYRAVARIGSDGLPWNESERISLAEALRAYTVGPAYGSFMEKELGTLQPGNLADLIVLDQNLFSIPLEMIGETKVKVTMVDGQVVYKEDEAIG